jgi:hypothetical protein
MVLVSRWVALDFERWEYQFFDWYNRDRLYLPGSIVVFVYVVCECRRCCFRTACYQPFNGSRKRVTLVHFKTSAWT